MEKKGDLLILDAGSGSRGSSLTKLKGNWKLVGLDISISDVISSKNKKICNCNYVLVSITHIPFKNSIFDTIINMDVLEHVEKKLLSCKEFYKTLKYGGEIFGSTSNIFNPIMFFDAKFPKQIVNVFTNKFASNHYDRHNRLNPYTLIKYLKDIGFKEYAITLLGFPPFNPWVYHHNPTKKIPIFAFFWIFFDKITNYYKLNLFKEMMFFRVKK